MNKNINFLYCFDENYNKQAFTSIISILNNISEVINIHIIHTQELTLSSFPKVIISHSNLNNISFYKFEDYNYHFPNTENVHISVATYFRLFINNYLPETIDHVVFLDPDVICLKNPIEELRSAIGKLKDSKYVICANTEHLRGESRINVDSKYFNAGFMIIDFEKWVKKNVQNNLIELLNKLSENIYQWDQDVLNSYFNGEYLEIEKWLNFKANLYDLEQSKNNIYFIHYLGSHKPWLTSGGFERSAKYYHENFNKINEDNYHITHKWKLRSLYDLAIAIFSLKIYRLDKPVAFLKEFIKSLFKK